jgi:hypothetical protein
MTPTPTASGSRTAKDGHPSPPGKGQAVLYLDFDGCLHHEAVYWDPVHRQPLIQAPVQYLLFQHAALLDDMLAPYPGIAIVLSTSWVRHYGARKAAKQLPPGLRSRIVGSTFDPQAPGTPFDYLTRGEQVIADVERRRPARWLALDDDPSGWPELALPHLLLTDPYEGISPPALQEELRRRLDVLANTQAPPAKGASS